MSSFLAYGGEYEFAGHEYRWRCYATARVHAVRKREHAPHPQPPEGQKWVSVLDRRLGDAGLSWLVDEDAGEFSQMLAQVEPRMRQRPILAEVRAFAGLSQASLSQASLSQASL